MKKLKPNLAAVIVLAFLTVGFVILSLLSPLIRGEADSICHYNIARYAFQYPHLFLDHWGKPLFTALSAPFAQFGYEGSKIFNILCGIFAALFVFLTARNLNYKNALAGIIFVLFTPVFTLNIFSSLTEFLFSLVLIAGIYFFSKQRYILSAVIILFPAIRKVGRPAIPGYFPAKLIAGQKA